MKKAFMFLIALLLGFSLQAQQAELASFAADIRAKATKSPKRGSSTLAPATRIFLAEWESCQPEITSAQNGSKTIFPKFSQLKETYGLRQVPSANTAKAQSFTYHVPVFIEFSDESALNEAAQHGLIIHTKLKTICTGSLPPDSLKVVSLINHIRYIEVATKAQPTLDSARYWSWVDEAHQGGEQYGSEEDEILPSYLGEGVVVGIVDNGFDYTHPTFYDADNPAKYRVKRVWDQMAETGTPPEGYDYGAEYTSPEMILTAKHCNGSGSHGTHVAGIAGGSGAGTRYGGMAPKSDLVFVPTPMTEIAIIDGIQYVKDYAASQQKPCVVNLSIGTHFGPHDGTSFFDRTCDQLKSNGFVLVGAAGNDGSMPLYLQHKFTANTSDTMVSSFINFLQNDNKRTQLDIWSDNASDFAIGLALIEIATGNTTSLVLYTSSSFDDEDDIQPQYLTIGKDTVCTILGVAEHNPFNGKARIISNIDASGLNHRNDYLLTLVLLSLETNKTMSAQMWLAYTTAYFSDLNLSNPQLKSGSVSHTVAEIGGTGNSIISVGAYMSRERFVGLDGYTHIDYEGRSQSIAPFSSHGPTADGRMKPDITAPGCHIISAYNSFDQSDNTTKFVQKVTRNNRSYYFGSMPGTSMAAPAAAGIIALWLQADPTLNVDKVKTILKETALNYPGSGTPGAEYTWGYGKIEALGGLQYIEQHKLKVTTEAATDITYTSAVLHFTISNGEGKSAGLYYHTTPSVKEGVSSQTVVCPYSTTLCSVTLNNLQANKTYYYQAYALKDGDTVWGNVMQFRTGVNPLTVTTENPENVTANSATLYLSVENNTDAKLGFYYHTASDVQKGQYIAAVHDKGSVYKANIRNLKPNAYYYFQAVGFSGGDTVTGKTVSFRTLQNTANEALASAEVLTVYPNPVSEAGELTVELPFEPTDVCLHIMDMSGKTLRTIPVTSRTFMITDLKAGFYLLQIDRPTANGNVRYQAKVIVQ